MSTNPTTRLTFYASLTLCLFWRSSSTPVPQAFIAPSSPFTRFPTSPPLTLFTSGSPNKGTRPADQGPSSVASEPKSLTHSDLEWRLCPPEGTSRLDRWKIKLGASIIRVDRKLRREPLPPVLCPRGGRALLEAYYKEPGKRKKKIARFGITTARGPSCDEIDATIKDLYQIDPPPISLGIAAVVYMFVEPEYRSRNVGTLALEIISAVHAVQGCDFTVLVADDNGTGGLVRWYEQKGFSQAPLMQNVLGSPDGQYGVAMISPVRVEPDFFDRCVIKWW